MLHAILSLSLSLTYVLGLPCQATGADLSSRAVGEGPAGLLHQAKVVVVVLHPSAYLEAAAVAAHHPAAYLGAGAVAVLRPEAIQGELLA